MKGIHLFTLFIFISASGLSQKKEPVTDWCNPSGRDMYNGFTEIKTPGIWFKTYQLADGVFAITEPYNFEQEISYLIFGKKKALLFDTGLGIDSISKVVKQLTKLPITVINTHTHYDHTGSNHEFENIMALHTDFTVKNAKKGWPHSAVKHEIAEGNICTKNAPEFDSAAYHVKPFNISSFINDGYNIDLGGRTLQVISISGHTPDAIALYDKKNGYLWTGDTFYEGQIYLFADETDLLAYEKSIAKLASFIPKIKKLFASHNKPISNPKRLTALNEALAKVKNSTVKGEVKDGNAIEFQFQYFDLRINKEKLEQFKK